MRLNKTVFGSLIVCIFVLGCSSNKNTYRITKNYQPADVELHKTIVSLDSAFFEAYNTCDVNLETFANFYTDDVEFYHDNGGFTNSKTDLVESTKKYICGKVTRELVKGSVEVYPIPNYGAIEMGLHMFHNNTEPNHKPSVGRFTIIWKKEEDIWKIAKVISLH